MSQAGPINLMQWKQKGILSGILIANLRDFATRENEAEDYDITNNLERIMHHNEVVLFNRYDALMKAGLNHITIIAIAAGLLIRAPGKFCDSHPILTPDLFLKNAEFRVATNHEEFAKTIVFLLNKLYSQLPEMKTIAAKMLKVSANTLNTEADLLLFMPEIIKQMSSHLGIDQIIEEKLKQIENLMHDVKIELEHQLPSRASFKPGY